LSSCATKGHTVLLGKNCDSPASPHFARYATLGRAVLSDLILATRLVSSQHFASVLPFFIGNKISTLAPALTHAISIRISWWKYYY